MSDVNPPALDTALAHTGFVKGLARALLGADPQVDDVVQDTWVVAARGGPDDPARMKGWLGGIVRRLSAGVIRKRATERRHEPHLPSKPDAPSTADVVAREEMRREVVEAMLELAEPYRSAILLRYYEDLPPREVARRLEVPVETARTRIKRGLALLRGELDGRPGGRASWTPLMGSLAGLAPTAAGAGVGLGVLIGAGIAALALVVGAFMAFSNSEDNPDAADIESNTLVDVSDEEPRATLRGSADPAAPATSDGAVPSGTGRIAGTLRRGGSPVAGTVGLHYVGGVPGSFRARMAATKNEEVVVERAPDRRARAGDRGRFVFDNLAAGIYIVSVDVAPGRIATRVAFVQVDGLLVDGSLDLPAGDETLALVARHGDGSPYVGIVHVQQRDREKGDARRANTVVRTDADGRVVLDGMLAGDVFIEARGERVEASTRADLPRETPVELLIGRTGNVLRGRVVARNGGTPIVGARVTVRIQVQAPEVPGRESRRVDTDRNGAFEIAFGKGYGEINVVVEADGWSTAWLEWNRVDAPLTFELDPETRITGRVVDPSGAPVAHARVTCATIEDSSVTSEREVIASAKGVFAFGDLRVGDQVALFVKGPDHASGGLGSARVQGRNPFLRELPAAGLSGVELVATPIQAVTGRVVDADGRGVAGAYVRLIDPNEYHRHAETPFVSQSGIVATDADGRFTIEDAVPGLPWAVDVEGPGVVSTTSPPIRLDEPATIEVTRLLHDRELVVRVVDEEDDTPIADVDVRLVSTREGGWRSIRIHGKTDADGRVRLSPVPDGHAGVILSGPHVEWNDRPVPIPTGTDASLEMTLRIPRRFHVEGVLRVTPDGTPGFGTWIEINARRIENGAPVGKPVRGRCDDDTMRFVVGPLGPGRWRVEADVDGKRAWTDVDAGATDAVIELEWDWKSERERAPEPEPETVTVRYVAVGPDGAPIPLVTYRSWMGGGSSSGPMRGERVETHYGSIRRQIVEFVDARDATGRRLAYGAVVVLPDEITAGDNVIELTAEKTIAGRVTVGGAPAPEGTQVSAHVVVSFDGTERVSSDPHDRGITDADGRFQLRGLGPYRYELRTSGSRGLAPDAPFVVEAGSTDAVIDLRPAVAPTLRITREDGTPMPGLAVRALREGQRADPFGDDARKTDVEGRVQLRELDPEVEYILQVLASAERDGVFGKTINPWTPANQTVVLESAYSIGGVVRSPDGTPVAAAGVYWEDAPNHWQRIATTDKNGGFVVHRVSEGGVEIRAQLGEQKSELVHAAAGGMDLLVTLDPGISFRLRADEGSWTTLFYMAVDANGDRVDGGNIGHGEGFREGRYAFTGRIRGATWTFLWVSPSKTRLGWLTGVRPAHGDTVAVPVLDPQVLEGRVEIPDGVSHELLRVVVGVMSNLIRTNVAADGTFRVEGLPPTDVEARVLRFIPPGEHTYGEPVLVRPGTSPVLKVPDA